MKRKALITDSKQFFEQTSGHEDIGRRDAFTKHYDLGGGRFQAVVSAIPVHFQADNGQWQEIDDRLDLDPGTGRYVTRSGNVKISVAGSSADARLISLSHRGYEFYWQFEKMRQSSPATIVQDGALEECRGFFRARATAQDRRLFGGKRASRATFNAILPGISVTYDIEGEQVKENIHVSAPEYLENTAIMLPDSYFYRPESNGAVRVLDKASGNWIFTMRAPAAWDSAVARNTCAPGVKLTPMDGYVRLEYTLSKKFLSEAVYPIVIDPVVTTSYTSSNISDTYIWEANPNTNYGDAHLMRCGMGEGGESISLVRFNKLVKQRASDTIVYAGLKVFVQNYGSATEYMAAYPLTAEWDEGAATWNTPSTTAGVTLDTFIANTMLDYVTTTNVVWQTFDITNLYRSWYEKDGADTRNFGIALRYPSGASESCYVEYSASTYSPSVAPQMVVNYVSHAGIAPWWQYEEQSIGRSGTASVDIYNGNLVYTHQDTAMNGSLMPVSIAHYYNSCLSDKNHVGCGLGWRTSASQAVYCKTLGGASYYVWIDGSGNEHYFLDDSADNSDKEDSEGMQLKYAVSGNNFTITYKSHNVMAFPKPTDATRKYISSIADASGNTANYTYTDGLLTAIEDGAGRTTAFEYSNGLLSSITAPGCLVAAFTYTGSLLTGISYKKASDNTIIGSTAFAYSSGMLTAVTGIDGVRLTFAYNSDLDEGAIDSTAPQQWRVAGMELTGGSLKGAKRLFSYGSMTTRVTAVSSATGNAGKTLTYQFNDSGNVVCVTDELGNAHFTRFDSGIPNAASESSRLQRAVVNKLHALAFGGSSWSSEGSNGTAAKDISTSCLSMPSIKIVRSGSGQTGYGMTAKLHATGIYTFSAYVNTAGITGDGAYLEVIDGGVSYTSRRITASTAELSGGPGADGWDRLCVTFTAATTSPAVRFVVAGTAGTAYFSCPQLESGAIANRMNMLTNSDFMRTVNNTDNSSVTRLFPDGWDAAAGITTGKRVGVLTSGHGIPASLAGNALRLVSAPNLGSVYFSHTVNAVGSKNDVFTLGGWCNSRSVARGNVSGHNAPGMAIRFYNGSAWSSWTYFEYNREWVGWQFGCWPAIAPSAYTKLQVAVTYNYNADTCMFTNVFLHREQFGRSFVYDENKNVVSASALSGEKSAMEYDNYDNLTSYVRPGAGSTEKYTMTYGSTAQQKRHLMATSTTPEGVKSEYTYDAMGNCTLKLNRPGSGGPAIGNRTTYIGNGKSTGAAGNYPCESYDARGNKLTRYYQNTGAYAGLDRGLVTKTIDAKNVPTHHEYDDSKRLVKSYSVADGRFYRNYYTYVNDRLAQVTHNTTGDNAGYVCYSFAYDALGRKTSVKVGSSTLSANDYATDRSGLLTKVTYGNGQYVTYGYDEFDRLTNIGYTGNNRYTYEYGANGQVARITDSATSRTTIIDYDLAGRPLQRTVRRSTIDEIMYRTTLKYDKLNQLKRFSEYVGSAAYVTTYAYDADGRTSAVQFGDASHKVAYTYDALGRISKKVVTNGSGSLTSNYTFTGSSYAPYGTGATTPLVSGISQGGVSFAYEYDVMGNITRETRTAGSVSHVTTYVYDGMNQLIRVNCPYDATAGASGTTWVYDYDRGGNITSARAYAYTTGTVGTAVATQTYTYGDTDWLDKLTARNGNSISYDGAGNMTAYNGNSFVWAEGRKLKQINLSDGRVVKMYDHEGTRYRKDVINGSSTVSTYYTYHGRKLMHQGNMHFFYDAQGRPAQVKQGSTIYNYVLNAQGDVVGLTNSAGTLVVEYKYDTWGKLLGISGSLASSIGTSNPLRYRGYCYDTESGLYYLHSRYYNPELRRFICIDNLNLIEKGVVQLFAYSQNNPVMYKDDIGQSPVNATTPNNQVLIYNNLLRYNKKIYKLNDPPMVSGTFLEKTREIYATGKASIDITIPGATVYSLGAHDLESLPLINVAKDAIAKIGIDVRITDSPSGEAVANVFVSMTKNVTRDDFGTGLYYNSTTTISGMRLVNVSSEGGTFVYEGTRYFIKNEDSWLSKLIGLIEMEE